MSNVPAGVTNLSRLKLARLQAELSRNMYSEHGLEALIRAVFLLVCQGLMVVSNCMPGSPQSQVDSAILCMMSRALYFFTCLWSFTVWVQNSPSLSYERMNSSLTRTELFAFWKKIDEYASESGPEPS